MRVSAAKIEQGKQFEGKMKKEEIAQLIEEVKKRQESDPDNILYIDSLERLRLALLLIEKFEASKPSYDISFSRGDWSDDTLPFGRLKSFLEDLKYSDIIEHLTFMLGGNGFFTVVKKLEFVNSIEELVNEVKENLGKSEEEAREEVMGNFRTDIISDFQEFKAFVEKDGFLAFWDDNKVINGKLKNQSEEIGRSQLMAFLKGRVLKSYIARDVLVGVGKTDIILIEDPRSPVIIEIKVLTRDTNEYEKGKFQLKDYVQKNSHNEGYYVLFQTNNYYDDASFEEENIKINQIVINIAPIAPTKVFREK